MRVPHESSRTHVVRLRKRSHSSGIGMLALRLRIQALRTCRLLAIGYWLYESLSRGEADGERVSMSSARRTAAAAIINLFAVFVALL